MNFNEMQAYIENHIKNPQSFPIRNLFMELHNQYSVISIHDGMPGPEFEERIRNHPKYSDERKAAILANPEQYLKSPCVNWQGNDRVKYPKSPFSKTRIGIVTGPASGILVLDIDDDKLAKQWFAVHGIEYNFNTLTVSTGKGLHFYFSYPTNGNDYYSTSDKPNGFDTRALGGYVLAYGSLHPNGNYYRIINTSDIAPAPQWLLDYILNRNAKKQVAGNNMIKNTTSSISNDDLMLCLTSPSNEVDLSYLNQSIQDLIKNGCANGHRSEAIGKVLFHMISNGYSEQEIKTVCFNKDYGLSEKFYEKNATFFDSEFQNAKDKIDFLGVEIKQKKAIKKEKESIDYGLAVTNLIYSFKYYKSDNGSFYAYVPVNNLDYEYQEITSSEFKSTVIKIFRNKYNKSCSENYLRTPFQELLGNVKNIATPIKRIVRFAQLDNKLIYYTGDKNSCIEITDNGYKEISSPDIVLQHNQWIKPISSIEMNCSGNKHIEMLLDVLDINDKNYRHTMVLFLLCCLFEKISSPILYFYGEGGASKTGTANAIKNILNPLPPLQIPRKPEQLAQIFDGNGIAHFDNFSSLTKDEQNKFCLTYSGGIEPIKVLYTTDQYINYECECPLMLSAVEIPKNLNNDLYTRIDFIKVQKHSMIKAKNDLEKELDDLYPHVRGELFNIASQILKVIDNFKPTNLSRHADYDKLGQAYFSIIGLSNDDYLNYVRYMNSNNANIFLSSDVVLTEFVNIINKNGYRLFKMSNIVSEIQDNLDDDKYDDLDSRAVGKKINSLTNIFGKIGVFIYQGRKVDNSRVYLAVTKEFLNNYPDFDLNLLNDKDFITAQYIQFSSNLTNLAVDSIITPVAPLIQ